MMRPLKLTRRLLAIVGLTLAPLVLALGAVLGAYFASAANPHSINWRYTAIAVYPALLNSVFLGFGFSRPLIDPKSRWGIFGQRERPRLRVSSLVVLIALVAPFFVLIAQVNRRSEAERDAMRAKALAFATEAERHSLTFADREAWLANACWAKDAAGAPYEGSSTWADQAREHENRAAMWRQSATRDAAMKKEWQQRAR